MKHYIVSVTVSIIFNICHGFFDRLSAQAICDPSLIQNKNTPLGYRNRGDRCEGLYINQVSSTTLMIASFTESFEDYSIASGRALQVEWDRPPGNSTIQLRAQSIKRKLYFRMDVVEPSANTSFSWSSDILASLNILKSDIGIVGFTQYVVGQKKRNVYVPLRIKQEGKNIDTSGYKLVLLPGVELAEVYISLAQIDPDGNPKSFIKKGDSLGYGYYPADRGIEIPISGLKEMGTYYMEIATTLRSGGSSTIEFWFYNPKRLVIKGSSK
jgi:hypothetical protein